MTLQSTVISLQSQMNLALTTALQNKADLEKNLVEAEIKIEKMLGRLANAKGADRE